MNSFRFLHFFSFERIHWYIVLPPIIAQVQKALKLLREFFFFLLGFYKMFCDLQEHFPLSLRNFTCLEISCLLKILFGVSVNALRFLSFLKDPKVNHTETIFEIHYRLLKIVCVRLLDDFMGTADGRRQWLLVRVAHARHRLNKHRTLFSNEPTCCCSLRFQTKSSITYFGFFFKKKAQYTMEYTSHKRNNVYISSGKPPA